RTPGETRDEPRARDERLNRLLEEKELLVREMNHRVKNSLQLVSSIIGLQLEGLRDAEAVARLQDAQARVAAIAKVHERLHAGSTIDSIEVGSYLEDVFRDVARLATLREGDIDLRMEVGDRTL